jgi:hypothetical protein
VVAGVCYVLCDTYACRDLSYAFAAESVVCRDAGTLSEIAVHAYEGQSTSCCAWHHRHPDKTTHHLTSPMTPHNPEQAGRMHSTTTPVPD